MIRIGDLSKLSRVPVKTLRYYDEVGLLKPVQVDRFTGYRMYEYRQLVQLQRILALKDLGFSLEEIGQLLRENVTLEQMRGMLRLRRAEAQRKVQEETERLEHVEAWLRQIEEEDSVSKYDVVIKRIEPFQVASVRGVVPSPSEPGELWEELGKFFEKHPVQTSGPCLALYHDEEHKESDWDLEACEPVQGDVKDWGRVKVRTLPAVETMACTLHHGPFTTINEAYVAIMKWIDANGYRVCGPAREVYVREAAHAAQGVSQTDPETVTEVQFPVEKAK